MRFLFFSFEILPLLSDKQEITGGASVQWKSWIKGFRDNGHEFGLLTFEGAKENINKNLNFDIVECYNPNYGINKLRTFYYQIPRLYKAIKQYDPDYLIQTSASGYIWKLIIIAKFLRIPFIHRIASDVHVDENINILVKNKKNIFLYRLAVKYSDFLSVQNIYQFNKLKEKYHKKNIFILHNPFELTTKEDDILPREKRNYIAWVGNFRWVKNLPALFNIARKLPEIKFKVAGTEHKNLDPETRDAIYNLKQLSNVEFMGYLKRSDIMPFISKSIALLNTSFYEGFSNTFLEAWSLGVPVVTTKNVNPDEIVNKYNLGKVADEFEQLSCSLKTIIDLNEKDFNKLALHCYQYVKENHNPKILAEKFVYYLKKIDL